LDRNKYAPASGLAQGAYVLADSQDGQQPDVILIGTGSEVSLCVAAYEQLRLEGVKARIVSMPSWELFDRQDLTHQADVLGRGGPDGSLFHLRLSAEPLALLEAHGHVPLPPYITHADDADDARRYQTVFAARPGAVAAPTAALHFDEAVLAALRERGVATAGITLHVGAGTFQPVRAERLEEHRMHSEWFEVSEAAVAAVGAARERGGRVVAVGTTSARSLESATRATGTLQPIRGETDIFITPGFEFRVVDALLTNFHLPRSTLMMLVSAFAGHARVMALYRHAIEARYRFFSYGDAMLLGRARC